MATDQYTVLGKAPGSDELKKLSQSNVYLTIKKLSAGYGKMEILHDFNLFVSEAQSLCLIGPNGAGKSTILHSIYGFTNIFSGQIEIDGKEITKMTPAQKLKSVGVAYILQDNSVFPDMTVEENLLMGGYIKDKTEDSYQEAEKLLEFIGLYQKRKLRAGDLSFGQQKLLELAMALMNEPKMLLLDEPTAGINPALINGIINRLIKVNKEFGITLLVIEHNMRVIMNLAQKIFCLAHGELLAEGSPEQIKNDKRVINAYLGAQ